MDYIVRVRFGNEEHYVTEFVTPWHHQVQALALALQHDVQKCYAWVCQHVRYPNLLFSDRHQISAFGGPFPIPGPLVKLTTYEFWQFPYETLGWMKNGYAIEDCDGASLLLCSMLRCFMPSQDVYVGVGGYEDIDHAWVRVKKGGEWYVLEATLDDAFPAWSMIEDSPYNLYCFFNDKEAVEVVRGSFDKVGARRKNRTRTVASLEHLLSLAQSLN